ncbi:MAG: pimeloyl-ACP methyl ester carboxylesterase [Crocinitomix sp.]|jgi:pimeloyl-ACP methyl ester carboxylesterase
MNQNIYVISGLGADHTVFCKLNLPGYTLVHVTWVPTAKGESLKEYARRLLPQINEDNPIVLGLSLGGMLAVEVSQLIQTKRVISLSSVTAYGELPFHFKLAGWLRLQKILPIYFFSKGNRFTQWIFGVKQKGDREILNQVFVNLDKNFLFWALNAVLTWKNEEKPKSLQRIHGSSDLILPKRKNIAYNTVIKKGTHLMLLDQAEEVSIAILKALKA